MSKAPARRDTGLSRGGDGDGFRGAVGKPFSTQLGAQPEDPLLALDEWGTGGESVEIEFFGDL